MNGNKNNDKTNEISGGVAEILQKSQTNIWIFIFSSETSAFLFLSQSAYSISFPTART